MGALRQSGGARVVIASGTEADHRLDRQVDADGEACEPARPAQPARHHTACNTVECRSAAEAVLTAQLAREGAEHQLWVKLEVIADRHPRG